MLPTWKHLTSWSLPLFEMCSSFGFKDTQLFCLFWLLPWPLLGPCDDSYSDTWSSNVEIVQYSLEPLFSIYTHFLGNSTQTGDSQISTSNPGISPEFQSHRSSCLLTLLPGCLIDGLILMCPQTCFPHSSTSSKRQLQFWKFFPISQVKSHDSSPSWSHIWFFRRFFWLAFKFFSRNLPFLMTTTMVSLISSNIISP